MMIKTETAPRHRTVSMELAAYLDADVLYEAQAKPVRFRDVAAAA